jgi:peptide/nickel transport system permease protein
VQFGTAGLLLVLAMVILGPLVAPRQPSEVIGGPYAAPDSSAPLGTDYLGRDVLSRVLHGGRGVVWMSITATLISVIAGVMLGLLAASARGWFDALITFFNDVLLAFPLIVFIMVFLSMLGRSSTLIVLLVAVVWIPIVIRLTRSITLEVLEQDYVSVAEMVGTPRRRILAHDILPNITTPLLVQTGALITWSVGIISALNFLGLGIQPPNADWGLMVNENRGTMAIAPWATIAPIVCIAVFVLSVNTLADGAGEALGTRREARP